RASPPSPPPRRSWRKSGQGRQQSANTDRNHRSRSRQMEAVPNAHRMSDYRIGIGIWDGVEELDFAGPYEVLAAWAKQTDERSISVETIAASADAVTCAHGLRVLPDLTWSDEQHFDLFLLPGGNPGPLQADGG